MTDLSMPIDEFPDAPKDSPSLEDRISSMEQRVDKLTGAVNQFGVMLQNIVDNVSGMSQAIQKGGIGGIMALMKGASSE